MYDPSVSYICPLFAEWLMLTLAVIAYVALAGVAQVRQLVRKAIVLLVFVRQAFLSLLAAVLRGT